MMAAASIRSPPIAVSTPVTVGTKTTDYYEIGEKEYQEQMHSDMPNKTRLRGYVDIHGVSNPNAGNTPQPHYLGPLIIAKKDVPVTIRLTNLLPNSPGGKLALPVDTTIMGAGSDPDGSTIALPRS